MINILLLALINALWTNSLHLITRSGMIFGFAENYLVRKNAEFAFWAKPLIQCPPCMSLWQSFIVCTLASNIIDVSISHRILVALVSPFLTAVVHKFND